MARKALARRIAEVLLNEPATRRGAGAAPTRRAARILAGCFVARRSKTTAGILPGTASPARTAAHPAKISQQRCYTSLRLGALACIARKSLEICERCRLIAAKQTLPRLFSGPFDVSRLASHFSPFTSHITLSPWTWARKACSVHDAATSPHSNQFSRHRSDG